MGLECIRVAKGCLVSRGPKANRLCSETSLLTFKDVILHMCALKALRGIKVAQWFKGLATKHGMDPQDTHSKKELSSSDYPLVTHIQTHPTNT